jgi:wobble nucleotide-excising tRNase
MVERIQLLRNIGLFDSIAPGAQLPFAKLTLIYAENARGKTTLSAVLRSLATGDATLIGERHRVGALHPPHVIVGVAGGAMHTFQNNTWSAALPTVAVFDDTFVTENVCSGIDIAPEHRKNLHELILGAQGVALNTALQTQITAIEEHNRELRAKGDAIPVEARGSFTVDQFCDLAEEPNLPVRLQEAERRLAAAQSAAVIQREAVFTALDLPTFDADAIDQLLARSLAELDAEAAQQVQAHLAQLGEGSERWVAEGINYIPAAPQETEEASCPFCNQSLSGSTIIQHYRAYFGTAYTALKQRIAETKRTAASSHGGDVAAAFERAVRIAGQRREFWSRFAEVPAVNIDTAAIALAWRAAREAVDAALTAKQAAPLEPIVLSPQARDAIQRYHATRATIVDLSAALLAINPQLVIVKEQVQAANVDALKADLARLRATQARHNSNTAPLCDAYLGEKRTKAATETLRDAARANLDNYRQNIFPTYENAINLYLERFGAGFRLQGMNSVNTRVGSSVTYSVLINQTAVPLTADVAPSFRSVLSSGDRNALALAFFFASLEQDGRLSDRIVVIDDPMTSLDEHRSLVTVQEITHLLNRVSQVIVLSHSKPFLMGVWNDAPNNLRTGMCLTRTANGSELTPWDVNQDCITEHDRRYARVTAYLRAANPAMERTVAADLRHLLEAFIRVAYPHAFPPGTVLGTFVNSCRQRLNMPQQLLDQADTQELDDILAYANLFHHETNAAFQTQIINDQQLTTFARRTLTFIRR